MTYNLRLAMAPPFRQFVATFRLRVRVLIFFQMKSLDDDILASLAMLRRYTNTLQSPIYRLPSDMFSEVASHLQPETDLVRLTHVSYRLRAALLSHPSLWSYIDTDHAERAGTFLQRSKQAPLRVNLVKNNHQEFPLLPSHMARLVSLEIYNRASRKQSILSQPMPALRRLKIVGTPHHDEDDEDDEDDEGDEDERENPPLWSLTSVTSLIVTSVRPIPLRVPHLTRLEFQDGEEETMIDPLLEFLDNCPLLEDLYISYVSEASSSRNRLVSLPHLRGYTQRMYDDHYSLRLFNMLSLPPTCSVTVRRVTRPSIVTAVDVVPPFRNPDYLDGITRIKFRTTCNSVDDGTTGTLELVNSKGAKVCSGRTVYGSSLEYLIHDESNLAHLRCLPGLNTRSVEILCLEGYRLWDGQGQPVDDVRDAFGFLPGLTTIILSFTSVEPCLLALDIDPDADIHQRHSPSVHTLVIHSDFYYVDWPDTLQTLLAVAQRRKAAGCPFRSVSLFLPDGPQSGQILDQLRECIEGFEVTVGDKVLGWDVDRYFLAGLDHLRKCRDV